MSPSDNTPSNHHRRHHFRRQQSMTTTTPTPTLNPNPWPGPPRPNLGPLTIVFTPPSQCTRAAIACPTCEEARLGQSCHVPTPTIVDPTSPRGAILENDTACWPSMSSKPTGSVTPGFGYYSPGVHCPTGYTSACTAHRPDFTDLSASVITKGPLENGRFQWPLMPGETAVGCCPTGFTCGTDPGGWQTCLQIVTSTNLAALSCAGNSIVTTNNVQVPFPAEQKTVSRLNVYAPLIQINWQSSDRPPSNVITSTSTSATSSTTTPSSSSSQLPLTITRDKLSTASIAAIGASSGVLGLCILSLLVFLCLRRRRQPTQAHPIPGAKSRSLSSAHSNNHPSHESHIAGSKVHTFNAFTTPLSGANEAPSNRTRTFSFPVPPTSTSTPATQPPRQPLPPPPPIPPTSPQIHLDTQSARFGRSLGVEDDLESPIDGTSPFRLKRGNTLKRNKPSSSNASARGKSPKFGARTASPLGTEVLIANTGTDSGTNSKTPSVIIGRERQMERQLLKQKQRERELQRGPSPLRQSDGDMDMEFEMTGMGPGVGKRDADRETRPSIDVFDWERNPESVFGHGHGHGAQSLWSTGGGAGKGGWK